MSKDVRNGICCTEIHRSLRNVAVLWVFQTYLWLISWAFSVILSSSECHKTVQWWCCCCLSLGPLWSPSTSRLMRPENSSPGKERIGKVMINQWWYQWVGARKCNSSALAMELHLSCTNPSMYWHSNPWEQISVKFELNWNYFYSRKYLIKVFSK